MKGSDITLGLMIGEEVPKNAPPALLEALDEIQIRQGDDDEAFFEQGFQIAFQANRSDDRSPDYAILNGPTLKAGNRVIITVTLGSKPQVLMDGIITHQQLTYDVSMNAVLLVTGRDLSILMDLEEKATGHVGLKHKDVVEKILKEYAKYGISARVSPPSINWPTQPPNHIPYQNGTDRDYLRRLAAEYGFLFYIRPGPQPQKSVACWGPQELQVTPQKALSVNMGVMTNVESISFSYDALASTQVYRAKPQDGPGNPTLVETNQSTLKPSLSKNPALAGNTSFVRKKWLGYSGPDEVEAMARAQAITNLSTGSVITVTGSLDVLRYGAVLVAPGLVGVRGVGQTYDGDYYVKSVMHIIRNGSYKQSFTLTREGLTSKTQKVKV